MTAPCTADCSVLYRGLWHLDQPCEECEGHGRYEDGGVCSRCKGAGHPICPECEGTGRVEQ